MKEEITGKYYYTIGEVSRVTEIKPYVLRYWESEFRLLRPVRRESGQRKYTQKDIDLISAIKDLLYNRKFTIAGAKRHLREEQRKGREQLSFVFAEESAAVALLKETKQELAAMLDILKHRKPSSG